MPKRRQYWHLLLLFHEYVSFESVIYATREESLLGEIQADELHEKIQDPTFAEEAQLIDVREPDEVYALISHFAFYPHTQAAFFSFFLKLSFIDD